MSVSAIADVSGYLVGIIAAPCPNGSITALAFDAGCGTVATATTFCLPAGTYFAWFGLVVNLCTTFDSPSNYRLCCTYRYSIFPYRIKPACPSRGYDTRSFEFIEDTFTCMPDRILRLTGLLRNRNCEWSCQAMIPNLEEHPALLPSMVEARQARVGCTR